MDYNLIMQSNECKIIENAFSKINDQDYFESEIKKNNHVINAVQEIIDNLEKGIIRIAEKSSDDSWKINEVYKKAILLYFKLSSNKLIESNYFIWNDKIPLQNSIETKNLESKNYFRNVPGTIVRKGAYVSKNAVLMPSFVNIGSYIDDGTMIDSFSTIGSAAQIGKKCHISEGVCIGGVLEPLNASPVIIEDNCFIGAKSAITEGIIIKKNSIIAAGVILTSSTKIIKRDTNESIKGVIPENSLVIPGTYKTTENLSINCAILLNRSKDKNFINEFLR